MIGNANAGKICRYFRESVLPDSPALKNSLSGLEKSTLKKCGFCKKPFITATLQAYCSEVCQERGNRKKGKRGSI